MRERDIGGPRIGRGTHQGADRQRSITARFVRRDFFTYVPTFKLIVIGNHKLHRSSSSLRTPDRELEQKLTGSARHPAVDN
jgi:hypothetical protein